MAWACGGVDTDWDSTSMPWFLTVLGVGDWVETNSIDCKSFPLSA